MYNLAFIDMEADNVSAVIGRYIQPVLTAAQKHSIPYFLMGEHWLDQFVPYNLISVRPRTVDLYAVTVDIVRMYNWTTVAVVYERPYGRFRILASIDGGPVPLIWPESVAEFAQKTHFLLC